MKLTGQIISGYTVKKEIGKGGMGVVFLAEHATLKTQVAIKAIYPRFGADEEYQKRFKREAIVHSKLGKHPKLIELINYIEQDGSSYILMEYFDSKPLSTVIGKEVGPIVYKRAMPIFNQMLDGLGYAHKKGVIHRDIKPSNILINNKDELKLMDFGIAKPTETVAELAITKAGQVPGSPQYMSPEQIKGFDADVRSDIYSLGITFYEILSGQLPFKQKTDYEIREAQVKNKPLDPREHYPDIPDQLVETVLKSLEKDPKNRQQSCGEFADELDKALKAKPVKPKQSEKPKIKKKEKPQDGGTNNSIFFGVIVFLVIVFAAIIYENKPGSDSNSDSYSADYYYKEGRKDYDKTRYDYAINDFNKAIAKKTNHLESRYYRSYSFLYLNKFRKALKDAKYLVGYIPGNLKYVRLRGKVNVGLKNYKDALDDFTYIISKKPDTATHYIERAEVKKRMGEYNRARSDLTTAIKKDKRNKRAYYLRGICLLEMDPPLTKKACEDLNMAKLLGSKQAAEEYKLNCR